MRIKLLKTKLNESKIPYAKIISEWNYKNIKFTMPNLIVDMMNDIFDIKNETEEYTYLLCFSSQMSLIGIFELSHGAINCSICNSREVMFKALMCNSAKIAIVHNHPSGFSNCSNSDIATAKEIKEAGKIMKLPMVDFIIVGDNNFCSFLEQGLLDD